MLPYIIFCYVSDITPLLISVTCLFWCCLYSVHEKSILLPLLPASLLAMEDPFVYKWLTHYGLLSMFPLLHRDGLVVPYIAIYGLYILLHSALGGRQNPSDGVYSAFWYLATFSLVCSFALHVIYLTVQPPEKYPFLYEAMMMSLCFTQFVWLGIYSNVKQWMLDSSSRLSKEKKHSWFDHTHCLMTVELSF